MDVYAKSSMSHDQIKSKLNIGCDGIEIQLLGELVDPLTNKYTSINQAFDLKQYKDYPIKVIHSPIVSGDLDFNLEQINNLNDRILFYNICELAEYFGKLQNQDILIVIHSEMSLKELKIIGILNLIIPVLDTVLKLFPHIKIAIENTTPAHTKNGMLKLSNNFNGENVELVKYIKDKICTDRIGTVLDTCHAMISNKYMNSTYPYNTFDINYDLRRFFEINKDEIFLIHLANAIGNGDGENHGTIFENEKECFNILDLYKEFNYKCPITLEVQEKDYLINNNYKHIKAQVDKYKCM